MIGSFEHIYEFVKYDIRFRSTCTKQYYCNVFWKRMFKFILSSI